MRWCVGWPGISLNTITMLLAAAWKAINIWCKNHVPFINRKVTNTAGLATAHRISACRTGFYHDRHSYEAVLDLSHAEEESIALAEAGYAAEDVRLLYVALTRAVWHCSLGVAPLVRRRSDKKGRRMCAKRAWATPAKGEADGCRSASACIEALCDGYRVSNARAGTDDRWQLLRCIARNSAPGNAATFAL